MNIIICLTSTLCGGIISGIICISYFRTIYGIPEHDDDVGPGEFSKGYIRTLIVLFIAAIGAIVGLIGSLVYILI